MDQRWHAAPRAAAGVAAEREAADAAQQAPVRRRCQDLAHEGVDRAEDTVPLVLDDYEYQDMYLIVGTLAHRFYPEEWTAEAKPEEGEGVL